MKNDGWAGFLTASSGTSATGDQVTISAVTGQNTPSGITWDFLIDNITFTSTPEPASLWLFGTGLLALGLARRPQRSAKALLLVTVLATSTSASAATVPPVVTLTCPSATGTVGAAYSSALSASGGVPPYTFHLSNGGLPGGLILNASTGSITGTPLNAGPAVVF